MAQICRNPTAKGLAAGRSEEEHGVCHLFLRTNVPDDSGRMRTSEMMAVLKLFEVDNRWKVLSVTHEVSTSKDAAGLRASEEFERQRVAKESGDVPRDRIGYSEC